jgi:ketosteroid isomerase-like protein
VLRSVRGRVEETQEIAMSGDISDRFTKRLHDFETGGKVDDLAALFSEDAELGDLTRSQPLYGRRGAVEFWSAYRSAFGKVRSTFTRILKGANHAVLEWRSDGERPSGASVCYRGVSIVEWRDGEISRFQTYYDSAAFSSPGAQAQSTSRQ